MRRRTVLLAVMALLLAGCAGAEPPADARADEFAREVRANGLAPHMTPRHARALYDDDGGVVCAALDKNPSDVATGWARTQLPGMPAEQTRRLVEYDRTVVRVYCPDRMARFDKVLRQLHYEAD